MALHCDQRQAAELFIETGFLTKDDIRLLSCGVAKSLFDEESEECVELLDEFMKNGGPSLQTQAFVCISHAIGFDKSRQDKIDSLPLPTTLKRRFLFKDFVI